MNRMVNLDSKNGKIIFYIEDTCSVLIDEEKELLDDVRKIHLNGFRIGKPEKVQTIGKSFFVIEAKGKKGFDTTEVAKQIGAGFTITKFI